MDTSTLAKSLAGNAAGSAAFPYSRRWRADLAKLASVILHSLLQRTADRSAATEMVQRFDALDTDTWIDTLAHPIVYSWCSETQKLPEITDNHWNQLAADLAHDYNPIFPHSGSSVAVWTTPNKNFRRRMKGAGPGSLANSSQEAEFLDTNSDIYRDATQKIAEALSCLFTLAPGFFADVNSFIVALGLADARASFRGSSALGRFGLVWFSPRVTWPTGIWAEELLHEATHYIIDSIAARQPLLIGDAIYEPKYPSPLRSDLRPAVGVYHALIVTGRILTLLDVLEQSEYTYPALPERRVILRDGIRKSAKAFRDGERTSLLGTMLFDAYVVPHL